MNDELIVVKQLPIIVEQLQTIKEEVTQKVESALNLICTDETVKEVKQARAELTKEFASWEEKRKQVKSAVMSPYEQFESVYKECITEVFKGADKALKSKIDDVENELKADKCRQVEEYFNEYLASKNINIPLEFKQADINITLSSSLKSSKEKAKAFIDRVFEDLMLIDTQCDKEEVLHEYKQTLNVSQAIRVVMERHKAIEQAKVEDIARQVQQQAIEQRVAKVEALAPPVEEEKMLTVAFKVTATKTKLKALKEFLMNGGYKYE